MRQKKIANNHRFGDGVFAWILTYINVDVNRWTVDIQFNISIIRTEDLQLTRIVNATTKYSRRWALLKKHSASLSKILLPQSIVNNCNDDSTSTTRDVRQQQQLERLNVRVGRRRRRCHSGHLRRQRRQLFPGHIDWRTPASVWRLRVRFNAGLCRLYTNKTIFVFNSIQLNSIFASI